ncbi:MAG: hypothetical protein JO110_21830 [Acetobacteraceae bacterium]|nr:hypothetical protein [Acetobacteraceae bacterium]
MRQISILTVIPTWEIDAQDAIRGAAQDLKIEAIAHAGLTARVFSLNFSF